MVAWPNVRAALLASGIRHIRDGQVNTVPYNSRLTDLGKEGINHSIGFTTNVSAADVTAALSAQAPYVDFVEPQNEIDASGIPASEWIPQIKSEQNVVYKTVRGNAAFSNVTVLEPALSTKSNYLKLGDVNPIVNGGNLHDATCNNNPGTSSDTGIAYNTELVRASTTKPIWTTETGYSDDVSRPCALPDDVIAKYDPRTVTERFLAGEYRTYFYQLADVPSDDVFGAMGLADRTGSPKPQLLALGSMISLLSDRGSSFAPTTFAFKITGSTTNLHHLLLEKHDGTFELLLWLEVPCWKPTVSNIGGTRIAVAPQTVVVTTGTPNAIASEYEYAANWSLASKPLAAKASSYTLSVGDSIVFLQMKK